MQILTTDGGPHPADKWAVATARELVPTGAVTDGGRMVKALKLQAAVAEALEPHHAGVQAIERAGIAENGSAHLTTAFDHAPHSGPALTDIVALAVGTPWEDHFADPAVQSAIRDVLANHFNTSADVERQWHADRNPGCPVAAAFKAERHTATVVPAE